MRKILAALIVAFSTAAHAGVPCSVPFNLTNGTTADASQVMANYNAILSCLANNTAASGVNSDITQLLGLSAPISPTQGGSSSYSGGSVSGTNSIVVASTTPTGWALPGLVGQKITFVATGSNSGATQLNVGSSGLKNFLRITPSGPVPMVGGEIVTGQIVEATWDGTQYQMTSAPALPYSPGAVIDYAGGVCPQGTFETTGSSLVSQASFPTLYANLGTIWGPASGGNFTIPDLRGRAEFGRDLAGSNRITAAGGNFDGTVVGNVGGQQNYTLAQANLGTSWNFPISGSISSVTATSNVGVGTGGDTPNIEALMVANTPAATNVNLTANAPGANLQIGASLSGNASSAGSGTPVPVLSNAAIVLKCIKM